MEIKEEEEELYAPEEEDQLHLNLVTTLPEDHSEPEPDRDQLVCQSPAGPRYREQDWGSNENEERSPRKRERTDGCHGNEADQSERSEALFSCKTFESEFSPDPPR